MDQPWDSRLEVGSASKPNGYPSAIAARQAPDHPFGPLDLLEELARVLEQQLACFGEFDAARETVEERGAQFLLKLAEVHAEGWLLDTQAGWRHG